jgi:hypothetical protein
MQYIYVTSKDIFASELLDGRLIPYGIKLDPMAGTWNPESRKPQTQCLTNGSDILWFVADERGLVRFLEHHPAPVGPMLESICEAFKMSISCWSEGENDDDEIFEDWERFATDGEVISIEADTLEELQRKIATCRGVVSDDVIAELLDECGELEEQEANDASPRGHKKT